MVRTNTQLHMHPLACDIPDPADRTPNDPGLLIESKYLRALFENREQTSDSNADGRYDYYAKLAESRGWSVMRVGNGVLLTSPVGMVVEGSVGAPGKVATDH